MGVAVTLERAEGDTHGASTRQLATAATATSRSRNGRGELRRAIGPRVVSRRARVASVLDRPWLDLVAVAGLVTGGLGLAYAFAAQARVRSMRRTVAAIERSPAVRDGRRALQRVAVVRYDAFPDSGGRLSWSTAVLDGDGSGVVITTITGRSDTRSYAKAVAAGQRSAALSPEEQDAVRQAMAADVVAADS